MFALSDLSFIFKVNAILQVYDQKFKGGGGGGGGAGWWIGREADYSERCLKWGGGEVIKESFQKCLKIESG